MKKANSSLYIGVALALSLPALSAQAKDSLIDIISRSSACIVTVTSRIPPNDKNTTETAKRGAGVILDERGIIVTNLHTVKFSDKIMVELYDGKQFIAKIIELWPAQDLALLAITANYPLPAIALADSDHLQLGEEIFNIGTSSYRKDTFAGARVSGLGRSTSSDTLEIIRVDLDLYQGDSGGALLDRRGHLVGMLSAKNTTQSRQAYAIPSNKIKNLYLKAMK